MCLERVHRGSWRVLLSVTQRWFGLTHTRRYRSIHTTLTEPTCDCCWKHKFSTTHNPRQGENTEGRERVHAYLTKKAEAEKSRQGIILLFGLESVL